MPRTDTKRIEVLRLIATVLQWDNEQREKAGLQRSYERSSAFGFFGFGRPAHKASETDNSIGDESVSNLFVEFLLSEVERGKAGANMSDPASLPTDGQSFDLRSLEHLDRSEDAKHTTAS